MKNKDKVGQYYAFEKGKQKRVSASGVEYSAAKVNASKKAMAECDAEPTPQDKLACQELVKAASSEPSSNQTMILFIFGGSTIILLSIYLILAFVKYRK